MTFCNYLNTHKNKQKVSISDCVDSISCWSHVDYTGKCLWMNESDLLANWFNFPHACSDAAKLPGCLLPRCFNAYKQKQRSKKAFCVLEKSGFLGLVVLPLIHRHGPQPWCHEVNAARNPSYVCVTPQPPPPSPQRGRGGAMSSVSIAFWTAATLV